MFSLKMKSYIKLIAENFLQCLKIRSIRLLVFFVIAHCMLTANFGLNILSFANSLWFNLHQKDSESLVLGRLVENKIGDQNSFGCFLGQYTNSAMKRKKDFVEAQYRMYEELSVHTTNYQYMVYLHQIGGQVGFLQKVDEIIAKTLMLATENRLVRVKFLNKVNESRIVLLQLVVAAVNAVVISLVLLWFAVEFDENLAWGLLSLTMASPWLTVFGRNLYWIMGSWYLPMVCAMWICRSFGQRNSPSIVGYILQNIIFATLMMISVFIKSTMGYEYLSTIVLAAITVLIYYGIKNRWSASRSLVLMFSGGIGSVAGFAGCLWIHYSRLVMYYGGSQEDALNRIKHMINARTVGNVSTLQQEFGATVSGNPIVILLKYVFSVWNLFPPYILFLLPFVWISNVVLVKKMRFSLQMRALAIATLFSMSAPISWFVLARGHSFVHFHLNYVLWHLPTMFFGGAILIKYIIINYSISVNFSKRPRFDRSVEG